ncbi:hypothetical protein ACFTXM_20580 [Streptomyces sp. NPDC056930]|uniref:hypothetical protein n=1 Tax=Streptomyces sp. NPDC056930 TaxID=3345967 RepID=UPI00363AE324
MQTTGSEGEALMAKFEEQIASIEVESITGGVVVSFKSTRREPEFNPREGRPRVKNTSVFASWDDVRGICGALTQREYYRSPGDEDDDTFRGFDIDPWDGEPEVRGVFQYFGSSAQLEVDLSGRTQSELLQKLQQALKTSRDETHIRFYDHRGIRLD